ncbi:hypothetical protein [Luteitalea sp.]|jgi:hypothetical protein|uniref:hypothetical protein n=1 Tax=Luteitalea sp. TaxID=2004800 RepID=UPI0037C7C2BA
MDPSHSALPVVDDVVRVPGLGDVVPAMRDEVAGLGLLAQFALRAGRDASLRPLADLASDAVIGVHSGCALLAHRVPGLADWQEALAHQAATAAALQAMQSYRAPGATARIGDLAVVLEAHARSVATAQAALEARLLSAARLQGPDGFGPASHA